MLAAASFVQAIQERQGLQISCPEEIAYRFGWIDAPQLRVLAKAQPHTAYGDYLLALSDTVAEGKG